jgi:hypothetical protein
MRSLSLLLLVPLLATPVAAQEPAAEVPPAGLTTDVATAAEPAEPAPVPRLEIRQPIVDAGTVQRGEKIRVEFEIENLGDADLVIREVQPACGCTVASFDKRVAPGATGKVTAIVDTKSFSGAISKGVTLISNDPAAPRRTLTVKAEILAHVLASPSYARFVHTQTLEAPTTALTVWSPDQPDFRVLDVRSPVEWVRATVREAGADEQVPGGQGPQWRVEITLDDDAPVGQLREFLTVTTNHPEQEELQVPLSGVVRPVLHLTPGEADFGQIVLAGQARELVLRLVNFGRDSVELRSVTTDVAGVSVRAEELEAGRKWKIVVEAAPSLDKGKLDGELHIETSSPVQPALDVPLRGRVG